MRTFMHQCVALFSIALIGVSTSRSLSEHSRAVGREQHDKVTLSTALQKPYLELFAFARLQQFTAAEINSARDGLKDAREMCARRFKEVIAVFERHRTSPEAAQK